VTSSRTAVWLLWLAAYVGTTVVLYLASDLPEIRVSHAVLAYMVLIIAASRHGGRVLAMTMVTLGYIAVDWFYVPPRFSFGAASDLDWIVLIGFFITGWLVSELFAKQREATRIAEERTREVERLSMERLQLEREAATARVLEEADRLKNALLSSLAHDLRSPVATLALLADPAAGFADDVALQRVGEEADRLREYLATLQRFATDGGNLLRVGRQNTDLLIQTALRSSEALLAGRTVRVEPPAAPVYVNCDLTLSVQVLGNLLQNAVRYAPPTQPIDITVRRSTEAPHMVQITVADRGPGVNDADVNRLFTPLRRPPAPGAADGDETAGARMGMGLSIARTFARAQRGDVTYRHRDGGGSEFSLRLPPASPA